jgi:hypothetical protein
MNFNATNATKTTNSKFSQTISGNQSILNQDNFKQIVQVLNEWKKNRQDCINALYSILKKHLRIKKNSNKSEIIANITAIAGASMVVIGLGIAPITFGLSLVLTFGGGAIGIAGSLNTSDITKKELKKVQDLLNKDKTYLLEVKKILSEQQIVKSNQWLDLNLTRTILQFIPQMINTVTCVLAMLDKSFNIFFSDENLDNDNCEHLKKKVNNMEDEIIYIVNCIRESIKNESL